MSLHTAATISDVSPRLILRISSPVVASSRSHSRRSDTVQPRIPAYTDSFTSS